MHVGHLPPYLILMLNHNTNSIFNNPTVTANATLSAVVISGGQMFVGANIHRSGSVVYTVSLMAMSSLRAWTMARFLNGPKYDRKVSVHSPLVPVMMSDSSEIV